MDESERKQQLIIELSEIAAELGWLIAVPESEDAMAAGLVLGTQDFMIDVLGDQIESFDIMVLDEDKLNPTEGLH